MLFTALVAAFGRADVARVLAGSATSKDAAWAILLVGYGASGVVLLWAGVAVVGDRVRRAMVAQIISTPLALVGTGLVVWALRGLGSRAENIALHLIVVLFIVFAGWMASIAISGLALRGARRLIDDAVLAARLKSEGPTVKVMEAVAVQGGILAPFRVAFVGYRVGAVAASLIFTIVGLVPALIIGAARIAWSRGEIGLWPFTPGGALTLLVMVLLIPYLTLLAVHGGREVLRHICIHRRMARFPEGLEYAQRTIWKLGDEWMNVPSPYADAVADRFHAWWKRLSPVEETLLSASLVLGPVLIVVALILLAQEHAR